MDLKHCNHCNADVEPVLALRSAGPHYADHRCPACGFFLGFVPKPHDDPTKYRRPNSHKELVEKYGGTFCELCLKKEFRKGDTLEAHHVIEFQDGGSNERTNIWILCTGCHKLIHWLRIYHGNDNDNTASKN